MSIGLVGVCMSLILGVVIGSISGFYGGWVDLAIQRVIEVVSRDEFDRDRARARWRRYGAAGAAIEKHEAGGA